MFSNKVYREATEAFIDFNMGMRMLDNRPFYYQGKKGIKAMIDFIIDHEEFELEIAMSYLDQINGIQTPFPMLPPNSGGQLEEV